jgi:hypothetical protein
MILPFAVVGKAKECAVADGILSAQPPIGYTGVSPPLLIGCGGAKCIGIWYLTQAF